MQIRQVTTSAIKRHRSLALTGVGHFRRPKNAMGVLRGCGCFTMSELSSTVGGWVGCGNVWANAESGISGPLCAVEPWNQYLCQCFRPQRRLPNRLQQRRLPPRQEYVPLTYFLTPSDKSRSGDNSHSLMSCLSKMHTTLLRVPISCASGPQFQLSHPHRMASLSPTCTAACISLTRNSSPSQAGSHTLVDA